MLQLCDFPKKLKVGLVMVLYTQRSELVRWSCAPHMCCACAGDMCVDVCAGMGQCDLARRMRRDGFPFGGRTRCQMDFHCCLGGEFVRGISIVRPGMKSLLLGGFPLCDFGVGSVLPDGFPLRGLA